MAVRLVTLERAFQNKLETFTIKNVTHTNLITYFEDVENLATARLAQIINRHRMIKFYIHFIADFVHVLHDDVESRRTMIINSNHEIANEFDDLHEIYEKLVHYINERISELEINGSGYTMDKIIEMVFFTSKYQALRGGSYMKLPKWLSAKKAILNVENHNDDMCFVWSVLAAIKNIKSHPERVTKYVQYVTELNLSGLTFPMPLSKITKFENQNSDIGINVYALDTSEKGNNDKKQPIYVLRLTKNENAVNYVNLFLLRQYDASLGAAKEHYMTIRSMSRLFSNQIARSRMKKYICYRCLNWFYKKEQLDEHLIICKKVNDCRVEMCNEDNKWISFKNYNNQMEIFFIIFFDIESLLLRVNVSDIYQKHKAIALGYYFYSAVPELIPSYYRAKCNENPIEWFCDELEAIYIKTDAIFRRNIPMKTLSDIDVDRIYSSNVCHICERRLNKKTAVLDHCHIRGTPNGLAHNGCNINYKIKPCVYLFAHNGKNYDFQFLLPALIKKFPKANLTVIPRSLEKYSRFNLSFFDDGRKYNEHFSFIFGDSYEFLPNSLDNLSSLLSIDEKQITKKEFYGCTTDQWNVVSRKGIMPYDFMDSFEKLKVTQFPTIGDFYSELNDTDATPEQYESAQLAWKSFNCSSMEEYLMLYLKIDVLLLSDVCMNFQRKMHSIFKLWPLKYVSLPSYTLDAMLRYTKVEIELPTDCTMSDFILSSIRGGMCFANGRYEKANNKYLDNRSDGPEKYLIFWDVCNLYGLSSTMKMPLNSYEWINNINNVDDLKAISNNSHFGYLVEADLHYPTNIHQRHDEFPFFAEHMRPPGSNQSKLLLTLYDKERYISHIDLLMYGLKNGVVLKKIHRVLKFHHSQWLKPYIDLCTEQRIKASSTFEASIFKLCVNAIYGKMCEQVKNRVIVKIRRSFGEYRNSARDLIASPFFKRYYIIDENFVLIEMGQTKVKMNRPNIVATCILEHSKYYVYSFHYSYIKKKFGDCAYLNYSDCDSFLYTFTNIDPYELMKLDSDRFDTSNFPENNRFGIVKSNKMVLGKLKSETADLPISEFVALRAKVYAFKINSITKTKKIKGIKRSVVKNKITFEYFYDCLMNNTRMIIDQKLIKSNINNVRTVKQRKLALSNTDNKRHILIDDPQRTLAHGNHLIS